MDEHKMSLAAFSGVCHYCKKKGHMAKDCRKKKSDAESGKGSHNGRSDKNLRPCKHCGGKHMNYQCWELPQNTSKRPGNWKSRKTETGAVAQDNNETSPAVELLLNGIDCTPTIKFPNDQGLLKNPNLWIADTAASMYMSPHIQGMINIQQNKGNGITVGNGEVMIAKQRGDIPSELCDSQGRPIMHATIKDRRE
jgi:hypothetical protein